MRVFEMTRETKTEKILMLNPYGKYLGYQGMNFIMRNKKGEQLEEIPFFKVGQIIMQSGNAVSTGALSSAGFWGIDVLFLTSSGRPVSTMVSLDDYSHVKTRIMQYKAYENEKGVEIAKQLVLGKIKAMNLMLEKYDFEPLKIPYLELNAEKIDKIRNKLTKIEGTYTKHYFEKILKLFPRKIRPEKRIGYKAYDGINNLLNFGYEFLSWRIYRGLWKAKLEPYLGFLHYIQHERPSLVCDLQEIYRVLIDDFVINYCKKLEEKDFEKVWLEQKLGKKKGKAPRVFLNHSETNKFIEALTEYFEKKVKIQRIKKRGKKCRLQTLINEECTLLAQYIRNEKEKWIPRIIIPD